MKKVVVINEDMMNNLCSSFEMTKYKFRENVKAFLSKLVADPINAKPSLLLKYNGLDYNPKLDDSDKNNNLLISKLLEKGIVVRKRRISDHDENGNPKNATMIIRYSVPKINNLNRALERLYIELFESNTNENIELSEDGCGGATSCGGAGLDGDNTLLTPLTTVQRRKINNISESIVLNEDNNGSKARNVISNYLQKIGLNPNEIIMYELVAKRSFGFVSISSSSAISNKKDGVTIPIGSKIIVNLKDQTVLINNEYNVYIREKILSLVKSEQINNYFDIIHQYTRTERVYIDMLHAFPILNPKPNGICGPRFQRGVARMWCNGDFGENFDDNYYLRDFRQALYELITKHYNEYDAMLNNLSSDEIINLMENDIKLTKNNMRNEINLKEYNNSDYNIIKIKNEQELLRYKKYCFSDDVWCIMDDETGETFNNYTANGIYTFYLCLRKDISENDEPLINNNNKTNPLDEYGVSMMGVIVDENGDLNCCVSRYNDDGTFFNEIDISNIVGVNFYEKFKPNTLLCDEIKKRLDFYKQYGNISNTFNHYKNLNNGYYLIGFDIEPEEDEYDEDDEYDNDYDEDDNSAEKVPFFNIIDKNNNLVLKKWVNYIDCDEKDEFIRVYVENKGYNICTYDGNFLLKRFFPVCHNFIGNYAEIRDKDNIFYIDKTGKKYDSKLVLDEKLNSIKKGAKVNDEFECEKITDNRYKILFNGKYNIIDNDGNLLSPNLWYNYISTFLYGKAIISLKNKYNYIDKDSNKISDEDFDLCEPFNEYCAIVTKINNENLGYYAALQNDELLYNVINHSGKLLLKNWVKNRIKIDDESLYIIENSVSKRYFCDGEKIIPYEKSDYFISRLNNELQLLKERNFNGAKFSNGYALIRFDGIYNYIDKEGKLIGDEWFKYAYNFKDNFAEVTTLNDEDKVIDIENKSYNKNELLTYKFFKIRETLKPNLRKRFNVVEIDQRYNIYDEKLNLLSDTWFRDVESLDDTVKVQLEDKTYNFLNNEGEFLSEINFKECDEFKNSEISKVKYFYNNKEKCNIINKNGELLLDKDNELIEVKLCYGKIAIISYKSNLDYEIVNLINDKGELLINHNNPEMDIYFNFPHKLFLVFNRSYEPAKVAAADPYTGKLISREWFRNIKYYKPLLFFTQGKYYYYNRGTGSMVEYKENIEEKISRIVDKIINEKINR